MKQLILLVLGVVVLTVEARRTALDDLNELYDTINEEAEEKRALECNERCQQRRLLRLQMLKKWRGNSRFREIDSSSINDEVKDEGELYAFKRSLSDNDGEGEELLGYLMLDEGQSQDEERRAIVCNERCQQMRRIREKLRRMEGKRRH